MIKTDKGGQGERKTDLEEMAVVLLALRQRQVFLVTQEIEIQAGAEAVVGAITSVAMNLIQVAEATKATSQILDTLLVCLSQVDAAL